VKVGQLHSPTEVDAADTPSRKMGSQTEQIPRPGPSRPAGAFKYKGVRYRTLGSEVKLRECDCNCKAVSVTAFFDLGTSGRNRGRRYAAMRGYRM
jgi:hypothetical protein